MPEQEVMGFEVEPEGPSATPSDRAIVREASLARVERDMHLAHQLVEAALGLTTARDWTVFGEKPWLCRSGCENVRRSLGISIQVIPDPDTKRAYTMYKDSDDAGPYFCVEVAAKVSHPALGSIEVLGFSSSRDKFFGQAGVDSEGRPIWKPLSEVNQNHLKMKAFTNMWVNAVTRFVGISNVDPAALEKRFGTAIARVEFGARQEKRTAEDVKDDNKRRNRLWGVCMALAEEDDALAKRLLTTFSAFTVESGPEKGKQIPGISDPLKLRAGRLFKTLERAEAELKNLIAKNPGQRTRIEKILSANQGEEAAV